MQQIQYTLTAWSWRPGSNVIMAGSVLPDGVSFQEAEGLCSGHRLPLSCTYKPLVSNPHYPHSPSQAVTRLPRLEPDAFHLASKYAAQLSRPHLITPTPVALLCSGHPRGLLCASPQISPAMSTLGIAFWEGMCVKVGPPGVLKETNLFSLVLLGGRHNIYPLSLPLN